VNGGVYWWDYNDVGSCENSVPVFYGVKLKGPPAPGTGYVAPKPLKRGVLYQVETSGSGSGYGSVWFKILPDGHVENYRTDPNPPVVDKNGYVVSGEAQTDR
jgi:hypothetical protein